MNPLLLSLLILQDPPTTKTSKFAWEHNGVDVTRWELCLNNNPCTPIVATKEGETYIAPFPALTEGSYTATVKACGPTICSAPSPSVTFSFAVVPDPVTGFRIVRQ